MKSETVKVGMVGLGHVATSHIKGYASHPHAEVTAVCDLDRSRAEQFAATHDVANVYTDYEDMLERASINTVDIGTPTFLHTFMTRRASEAGKHVHCEKPFCRSVAEGLEACEAVRQNGVKLVVGETYIFITSHMKARELIEAGEIGRPLQMRQRHGPWLKRKRRIPHVDSAARHWRVDGEKSGGGNYPWIFDHAVHFFATAEYLMMNRKISEVHAVTGTCQINVKKSGAAHNPYTILEVDIPIITWKYEDTDC